MTPALATVLAVSQAVTGQWELEIRGGFTVLDIVPGVPPIPLLTGDVRVGFSLAPGVELSGRYATTIGLVHRIGPELAVELTQDGPWAIGFRVHPSVRLSGATKDGIDIAGDVSTQGVAVVAFRRDGWALTAEAGVTVQWVLFQAIGGDTMVDADPYLAFYDMAVQGQWTSAPGTRLTVRLELSVPRAPDDPFAVWGMYPRALFGAEFDL